MGKRQAESRAEQLREIAERCGCRVVAVGTRTIHGSVVPELHLDCHTNARCICVLNEDAKLDAMHMGVRTLALDLRKQATLGASMPPRNGKATRAIAARMQRFVQEHVAFFPEPDEVFQTAAYTLDERGGDCDDHARLVAALLLAAGEKASVVGVKNSAGAIRHVCARVFDPSSNAWLWVETTLAANLGEEPRAAANRLGLFHRTDITGAT